MEKKPNMPYKVTAATQDGAKKVTISLTGDLTLDKMPDIKLLMMQNLDKYQFFHVVVEEVENIDLGLIQLLYSFRWTAERKSKKVTFKFSLPEEYKTLLAHGGFVDLINIDK